MNLVTNVIVVVSCDLIFAVFVLLVLLSGWENYSRAWKGAWDLNITSISTSLFVKPSLRLVREAAEQDAALCIIKYGRFSIRKENYIAASHVWGEVMYWNRGMLKDERGLRYDRLKEIVTAACRAVENPHGDWVWLDLACILQGSSSEEEELRTIAINSVPRIYANIDCVVVLDALCLQLNTSSLLDVAAVLSLGRWRTRMWTYQETKLARKADILNKNGRAN